MHVNPFTYSNRMVVVLAFVAGATVQTTGRTEFEDGFWISRESVKGSKWPVEGLHYPCGSSRG